MATATSQLSSIIFNFYCYTFIAALQIFLLFVIQYFIRVEKCNNAYKSDKHTIMDNCTIVSGHTDKRGGLLPEKTTKYRSGLICYRNKDAGLLEQKCFFFAKYHLKTHMISSLSVEPRWDRQALPFLIEFVEKQSEFYFRSRRLTPLQNIITHIQMSSITVSTFNYGYIISCNWDITRHDIKRFPRSGVFVASDLILLSHKISEQLMMSTKAAICRIITLSISYWSKQRMSLKAGYVF